MNKKILCSILALFVLACGTICCILLINQNPKTIICTSEKDSSTGIEMQNVATYNFNGDKYVTDYTITTTQKFNDQATYDQYKSAQKETVAASTENISYDLKSDDATLTLVFAMTFKNIDINKTASEAEKADYHFDTILKNLESAIKPKYTCEIK